MTIGLDAWSLGLEASAVIGLRAQKLAGGGPAAAGETRTMIAEKIRAHASLQAMALSGGLGSTPTSAAARTLHHYRRAVRANRRRLSAT